MWKQDTIVKEKMKTYADKQAKALRANLKQGEVVLVKQPKLNKLSIPFAPTPLVVSDMKGSMITDRYHPFIWKNLTCLYTKEKPEKWDVPPSN